MTEKKKRHLIGFIISMTLCIALSFLTNAIKGWFEIPASDDRTYEQGLRCDFCNRGEAQYWHKCDADFDVWRADIAQIRVNAIENNGRAYYEISDDLLTPALVWHTRDGIAMHYRYRRGTSEPLPSVGLDHDH